MYWTLWKIHVLFTHVKVKVEIDDELKMWNYVAVIKLVGDFASHDATWCSFWTMWYSSSRLLVSTSGNNKRQFALHGVTSDTTKFYHVFASIDQNAAQHLMDIIAKPPEVSCPKRQEKNGFLKFCAEWVVFFVEDWLSVHFESSFCRPQISPQARCADTAERLDGGFPSGQFAVLNPFSTFLSVFFFIFYSAERQE